MVTVAVGVDVGLLSGRGLDLVALDASRKIIRTARHVRDLDQFVKMVLGLAPDVVCIDSPSQWAGKDKRRPAEQELTRRGINLYTTPSEDKAGTFHDWMRDGFRVYAALALLYPRVYGRQRSRNFGRVLPACLRGRLGGKDRGVRR